MNDKVKSVINILGKKDKPVSLIHFITNKCNARCPHCFIDFDNQEEQKMKMSLEDVEKLTKNIGPELLNVNITGGEPFYSRDIQKICQLYIENTSVETLFFSTHGGPVKQIKEFLEFAKDYPDKIFIFSLSIDHIGEKHSDYRKVKNLFSQALESYNLLKKASSNIRTVVSITVSEFNCEETDIIFDTLTQKYQVDEITANIVRDEGVYKIEPTKKQKIHEGYMKLIDRISNFNQTKNKVKEKSLKSKVVESLMDYKDEHMHRGIAKAFLNPQFTMPCYAGGGLMGIIYTNGDVYPCEVLDKKMGNLYDYDFDIQKLWSDNKKLRKWIIDSKCNCTYECAWSYNLLASKKEYPGMAKAVVKGL